MIRQTKIFEYSNRVLELTLTSNVPWWRRTWARFCRWPELTPTIHASIRTLSGEPFDADDRRDLVQHLQLNPMFTVGIVQEDGTVTPATPATGDRE